MGSRSVRMGSIEVQIGGLLRVGGGEAGRGGPVVACPRAGPYGSPFMNRPRTVVTIGNFDGVHVGHAALVSRARERADKAGDNARVVAVCLDPHPLTVLRPEAAPPRL